jgi:hypothetical protein
MAQQDPGAGELESLETTKSGAVRKADAMEWLANLDDPTDEELLSAVTIKPNTHSGSTFAEPISTVRLTGDADFIAAAAALLKPLLAFESSATRCELKVQKVEDRDTGELTDNYALYFNVAERGGQGKIASALMGTNKENDKKLLDALDGV